MIIDVLDVTEESDRHEEKAIRASGGRPIVMYGMSGGVEHMVQQVSMRAGLAGQISLLRFHGHGGPGMMNVSAGKEAHFEHHSGMANSNSKSVSNALRRLRPFFADPARVELHGCNVAQGVQGEQLLKNLARIWGVPVSAGTETQYGGTGRQFTFEGPVHTALPSGAMLCGMPY